MSFAEDVQNYADSCACPYTEKAMRSFARRMSEVEKSDEDGCWLWPFAYAGAGYGYISVRVGVSRKNLYVYRLALEVVEGVCPEGKEALHSCDQKRCFNPSHLKWGTHKQNIQELIERDLHGDHMRVHPSRKLLWRDVLAIRADRRPLRTIANEYGVHHSSIWRVKSGLGYRREHPRS